jgi:hypothetical protein
MSARCLLGFHKFVPTKQVVEIHPMFTTYTNAICRRCKKREWWSWYPLPEQQASVGTTSEVAVVSGTEETT